MQIYQVEKDRTFTRWKEQMAALRLRRSINKNKNNAAASRGAALGNLPTFNNARGDRSKAPVGSTANPRPAEGTGPPKKKSLFSWLGGGSKAPSSGTKGDPKLAALDPDGKVVKPDAGAASSQGAAGSPSSPVKPDFRDQVTSFLEEVQQKTRKAEIEAEVLAKEAV